MHRRANFLPKNINVHADEIIPSAVQIVNDIDIELDDFEKYEMIIKRTRVINFSCPFNFVICSNV